MTTGGERALTSHADREGRRRIAYSCYKPSYDINFSITGAHAAARASGGRKRNPKNVEDVKMGQEGGVHIE